MKNLLVLMFAIITLYVPSSFWGHKTEEYKNVQAWDTSLDNNIITIVTESGNCIMFKGQYKIEIEAKSLKDEAEQIDDVLRGSRTHLR